VLEGLAVRQTAERIDDAGIERLQGFLSRQRTLLEQGDLLGASDTNADLHSALLELSGHGTAQRLIRTLNSQTVRYQYRTILIPGRSAASVAEHSAIVEAVTAGKPDEAEAAMRRHLFNVAESVQQGLLPGGIDKASRGVL
jgi:DNA-binding GntR family transcriptional regulator